MWYATTGWVSDTKIVLQTTQWAGRTLVIQYVAPGLCRGEVRCFMYFVASFNDAVIDSDYTMLTVDGWNVGS